MNVRKLVRFVTVGDAEYEVVDRQTGDSICLVNWSWWKSKWTAFDLQGVTGLGVEFRGRTRIEAVKRLIVARATTQRRRTR